MTDLFGDPRWTWFLARSTGLVCLVLLSVSVALGVLALHRVASSGWPRFLTQGLHRNVSLTVVALLGVHIVAVVLDSYVTIDWIDAVLPFVSSYRTVWLGLGTVAFDLVIALIVTSLLRHRLGQGGWRAVHWTAYLCWPAAVVHGLGTGSDARRGWMVWLTVACVGLVLLAVAWRIVSGWPRRAPLRLGAVLVTACAVAVLLSWARQGPLAPGWSKRAGTPAPAGSSAGR